MKTFLRFFGAFILLIIVVGLLLDNNINVTRQIEINATPSQIHALVDDLDQWPKWSPWLELDPTIKTELGKITKGVGAEQSWTGQSGAGYLKMTESSVSDGIVYDLIFDGDSTAYVAGLNYQVVGDKTLVTWYMQGEMQPLIIGNYFAQMMDMFVGDSFVTGLQKLKDTIEKQ